MRPLNDTADRRIARVADRGHGIATREELLGAGVTHGQIRGRRESGALHEEYPGVYRVGHRAPSIEATYLAAVLACGDGAFIGGPAAAWALGLVRGAVPAPVVISPRAHAIPGLDTRRTRRVDPRDLGRWRGIPMSGPARTLVDLAAELGEEALARACHEAAVRHRTTPGHVDAVLARRPNSPGAAMLRAVLRGDVRVTLSELEARFLAVLRAAGLPLPRTNRPAGGRYVDCRWTVPPLTVELDSYRFHSSRHAWERDRHREREAYARGDDFRRYTYGDVFEDTRLMLSELRSLLCRREAA